MTAMHIDDPSFVFTVFRVVIDLFWFVVALIHHALAATIFVCTF
jgi:hypothetical protein